MPGSARSSEYFCGLFADALKRAQQMQKRTQSNGFTCKKSPTSPTLSPFYKPTPETKGVSAENNASTQNA